MWKYRPRKDIAGQYNCSENCTPHMRRYVSPDFLKHDVCGYHRGVLNIVNQCVQTETKASHEYRIIDGLF